MLLNDVAVDRAGFDWPGFSLRALGKATFYMCNRRHLRDYLRKKHPYCIYCLKRVGKRSATLDHLIPVSRGGSGQWDNQVLACKVCNNEKGDMLPLEFILWKLSYEKADYKRLG